MNYFIYNNPHPQEKTVKDCVKRAILKNVFIMPEECHLKGGDK